MSSLISAENLKPFFAKLAESGYFLFIPEKTSDTDYSFCSSIDNLAVNPYRCLEPLRSFINPVLEDIGSYFAEAKTAAPKKQVIFGLKSCDLQSLKVQDYIFLEGVTPDPVYKAQRENTVTILNIFTRNILTQPVRNFFRNKNYFRGTTTFWIWSMKFSILDILGFQFQNFTDSHSTPCHQFKHKPVPGVIRFENEFINGISFQNFPGR